jgi:hypothetical protein
MDEPEKKKNLAWYQYDKKTLIPDAVIASIILLVFFTVLYPFPCKGGCASTSAKNTAITKEAASIISGAFSAYQLKHKLNSKMTTQDLLGYINHVKIDTSTKFRQVEHGVLETKYPGSKLQSCTEKLPCLSLHNGGIIQFDPKQSFGGTTTTHALVFNVDPDGIGTKDGKISFYQFYNGRFSTAGIIKTEKQPVQTQPSPLEIEFKDPYYLQWINSPKRKR